VKAVERHWYPLAGERKPVQRARRAVAAAAKKPPPIDPLTGPKLALAGRVVTMNDDFTVIDDGVVYVDHGSIVEVQARSAAPPEGFAVIVQSIIWFVLPNTWPTSGMKRFLNTWRYPGETCATP